MCMCQKTMSKNKNDRVSWVDVEKCLQPIWQHIYSLREQRFVTVEIQMKSEDLVKPLKVNEAILFPV